MKMLPRLILSFIIVTATFAMPAKGDLQEEERFATAREKMVREQLLGRDIKDENVVRAMAKLPRHLFVDASLSGKAYNDHPLPIDEGQTISQPYVVALMTQAIGVKPGQKVLEVGTGSGYQAAVLSEMGGQVYTIEIRPKLAEKARSVLQSLAYGDVKVRPGDGYYGWPEAAPFDAIMVTAAANHIPPPLLEQLAEGGKLVIPLGSTAYFQTLTLVEKKGEKRYTRHIGSVQFVPMVGKILETNGR